MASDQRASVATLIWGVKQSFRAYVEGSGGAIDTGAGAAREPDGAFVFAAAPGARLTLNSDGRPQGRGDFVGEVRFEAHGGMLKVFLADPTVEISSDVARITVADNEVRDVRVQLAELDLAGAARDGRDLVIPTKLSKDGWRVLGDHYPPMTPLDPVRLRLG
jgi:hypothetical protein